MARDKDDLDRHITGNYGEDAFGPCGRQRGFDRFAWDDQPDAAYGSHKTDKETDDETIRD